MALSDRVALISCRTKGIGLGIARAFVQEGAKVLISGRNEATGEQAGKAAAASHMDVEVFLKQYSSQAAIGRPITVEGVASLAVVVASEEGGGISGAALSVDGGTAAD